MVYALDVILSISPLVLLVLLMTAPRIACGASKALPITAIYLYFLRLVYFSAGANLTNATVVLGLLEGIMPTTVVFSAILLFKVMTESGSLNVIQNWLLSITNDPVAQLQLIGFAFLFLLEGTVSSGTPGVLASGLLISLGFEKLPVAVFCLIHNTMCVCFGAVGVPIWFGLGTSLHLTDDQLLTIGIRSAFMHNVAYLVIPIVALLYVVPWSVIRQRLLLIYASTLSTGLVMFGCAFYSYEFPSMIAGAAGVAVTATIAHKYYPNSQGADGGHHPHHQLHDEESAPSSMQIASVHDHRYSHKDEDGGQLQEKGAAKQQTAAVSRFSAKDEVALTIEDATVVPDPGTISPSSSMPRVSSASSTTSRSSLAQPRMTRSTSGQHLGAHLKSKKEKDDWVPKEPDSAHVSTAMFPSEHFHDVTIQAHKSHGKLSDDDLEELRRTNETSTQTAHVNFRIQDSSLHSRSSSFDNADRNSISPSVSTISALSSASSEHFSSAEEFKVYKKTMKGMNKDPKMRAAADSYALATALFPCTRLQHHSAQSRRTRDARISQHASLNSAIHADFQPHHASGLVRQRKIKQSVRTAPDVLTHSSLSIKELAKAFFPLYGTFFLLLLTRISQIGIKDGITATSPALEVPLGSLATVSITPGLNLMISGIFQTNLSWSYQILYIPALIPFLVICAMTAWIYSMKLKTCVALIRETAHRVRNTAIALMGALVFVKLFISGGDSSCSRTVGFFLSDLLGQGWIWFAGSLGCFGAFFSGSNNVSNLTFGDVQVAAANNVGQDVLTVLAAQTTGGALGNMVSYMNALPLATFMGLENAEKVLLKKTLGPCLLYLVLTAITAYGMVTIM
eukprot:ANDGO_02287.mRNA.1 Putative L-lactate permease